MTGDILTYFKDDAFRKMLSAFSRCTELPLRVLDLDGNTLLSYMGNTVYCEIFQKLCVTESQCLNTQASLCKEATKTQAGFIAECPCGLNCYAIPILQNSHAICTIIAGPFLLGTPDPYLIADLPEASGLCARDIIKLQESVNTVSVISQSRLLAMEDLITSMFRMQYQHHITSSPRLSKQRESIKDFPEGSAYPYEKETLLISEIKSGNVQNASAVLNDLLGYVLFTKNGSLDTAKVRAIELCCVLSRVTIENGATKSGVLNFNNECITSIQTITDIYDLGERLQEITEVFISSISQQQQKKENVLIRQSADYIALHYATPLTLEELSNHVHLNPSYFSSLFKQNTGTSFKTYLNMIRTENSKSLLSSGERSLAQIAAQVGFQDYNYFAKVFKKLVGLTPSQYRNQSMPHVES